MSQGPCAAPMLIPCIDQNGDATMFNVSLEQLALNVYDTGCLGNQDVLTLAFLNQIFQKWVTPNLAANATFINDEIGFIYVSPKWLQ